MHAAVGTLQAAALGEERDHVVVEVKVVDVEEGRRQQTVPLLVIPAINVSLSRKSR